MHLSEHSLRQLDEAYLRGLEEEALRGLSVRLLADLKEAHERLNQTPTNSSRPPSSRAPWERMSGVESGERDEGGVEAPGAQETEDVAEARGSSETAPAVTAAPASLGS